MTLGRVFFLSFFFYFFFFFLILIFISFFVLKKQKIVFLFFIQHFKGRRILADDTFAAVTCWRCQSMLVCLRYWKGCFLFGFFICKLNVKILKIFFNATHHFVSISFPGCILNRLL